LYPKASSKPVRRPYKNQLFRKLVECVPAFEVELTIYGRENEFPPFSNNSNFSSLIWSANQRLKDNLN
jgi:hypothetical protein